MVYGFLAVVLAGGMTPTWRWLPYAWAGMLITLVGSSQLYFGAHWLTDVLGSLTLGLAWVATLGLAYRRHRGSETDWHRLGAIALEPVSSPSVSRASCLRVLSLPSTTDPPRPPPSLRPIEEPGSGVPCRRSGTTCARPATIP